MAPFNKETVGKTDWEAVPGIQVGRSPVFEDQTEAEAAQAQDAVPAHLGPGAQAAGFRQSPQKKTGLFCTEGASFSVTPFRLFEVPNCQNDRAWASSSSSEVPTAQTGEAVAEDSNVEHEGPL